MPILGGRKRRGSRKGKRSSRKSKRGGSLTMYNAGQAKDGGKRRRRRSSKRKH